MGEKKIKKKKKENKESKVPIHEAAVIQEVKRHGSGLEFGQIYYPH